MKKIKINPEFFNLTKKKKERRKKEKPTTFKATKIKKAFLENETIFPLFLSRMIFAISKIFSEWVSECKNISNASSFVISLFSRTLFKGSKSNCNLLNKENP